VRLSLSGRGLARVGGGPWRRGSNGGGGCSLEEVRGGLGGVGLGACGGGRLGGDAAAAWGAGVFGDFGGTGGGLGGGGTGLGAGLGLGTGWGLGRARGLGRLRGLGGSGGLRQVWEGGVGARPPTTPQPRRAGLGAEGGCEAEEGRGRVREEGVAWEAWEGEGAGGEEGVAWEAWEGRGGGWGGGEGGLGGLGGRGGRPGGRRRRRLGRQRRRAQGVGRGYRRLWGGGGGRSGRGGGRGGGCGEGEGTGARGGRGVGVEKGEVPRGVAASWVPLAGSAARAPGAAAPATASARALVPPSLASWPSPGLPSLLSQRPPRGASLRGRPPGLCPLLLGGHTGGPGPGPSCGLDAMAPGASHSGTARAPCGRHWMALSCLRAPMVNTGGRPGWPRESHGPCSGQRPRKLSTATAAARGEGAQPKAREAPPCSRS